MAPFIEFTNWDKRKSDQEEQIDQYKKYFLLCEGENTEKWYFENLIDNRKVLGIHPTIDVIFLERTEEDLHNSSPKRLLEYANRLTEKGEIDFDKDYDKIIIVFDCDIFNKKGEDFNELLSKMEEKGYWAAVTNPSFELFLLLHKENSVKEYILPNETKLLENKKTGTKTAMQIKFTEATNINPKKNKKVGEMCSNLNVAIEQEKLLNQDINISIGRLTSNIGKIIEEIRKDKLSFE